MNDMSWPGALVNLGLLCAIVVIVYICKKYKKDD